MNITGKRFTFSVLSSGEGNPRAGNDPIMSELQHIISVGQEPNTIVEKPTPPSQHHHSHYGNALTKSRSILEDSKK